MNSLENTWLQLEDSLRGYIFKRLPDRELANDLLQEVFIKVHQNIDSLKNETKLKSWIYQIAMKEALLQCCHYEFDKYGTVVDIQPHGCCHAH